MHILRIFLLTGALAATPFARAGEFDANRRLELYALAKSRDSGNPAARLVAPTGWEGELSRSELEAVVAKVLKMEREVAGELKLSRRDVWHALDVVLQPRTMILRARTGELNAFGTNRYTDHFRDEVWPRLRLLRPGLGAEVEASARSLNVSAAVSDALGLIDWHDKDLPLRFTPREDASFLDVHSLHEWADRPVERLRYLAKWHLQVLMNISRTTRELKLLEGSTLRDQYLAELRDLEIVVRDQVDHLPQRIEATLARVRRQTPRMNRQVPRVYRQVQDSQEPWQSYPEPSLVHSVPLWRDFLGRLDPAYCLHALEDR